MVSQFNSLENALKDHFGYDQFRPGQKQIITEALNNNKPLESVFKTLKKLQGSFALGIIFKNFSNIIIGARRGSPLAYSNLGYV